MAANVATNVATTVVFEGQVEIPMALRSLADARRQPLVFRIHRRGTAGLEPVEPDAQGFQHSAVFGCRFRLDARVDAHGMPAFDLRVGG